ncbi:MAG: pyridoxamine 5'-phosphate oxidase [Flavobacteriales bacterium]|nr:pyridoxamine 5'-phosphate oxidase [Flavobacteriales bacterium]
MGQHTHDRIDYSKMALTETEAGMDPIALFGTWFEQAQEAGVHEPHAMTLATVGSLTISCRVVLMRSFDAKGFTFFSNYNSRKAMDLERDQRAALNFFWPVMERQVRIEGKVELLTDEESDAYFSSRPRESRIAAWSSDQSRAVDDRDQLEKRFERWSERFADSEVPRPLHWGGYRVRVQRMEFWQGRPNRLHDRIAFEHFADGTWARVRLQP